MPLRGRLATSGDILPTPTWGAAGVLVASSGQGPWEMPNVPQRTGQSPAKTPPAPHVSAVEKPCSEDVSHEPGMEGAFSVKLRTLKPLIHLPQLFRGPGRPHSDRPHMATCRSPIRNCRWLLVALGYG